MADVCWAGCLSHYLQASWYQPARTRCRQTLHLPVAFFPFAQKVCDCHSRASSPRCLHS